MSNEYEEIQQRILDNINYDIDKREGSFTNNMISPIASELAMAYIDQHNLVDMAFIKNGFYNYLDTKCEEYGISRRNGVKANGEVLFNGKDSTVISNGTVLSVNGLYFVVLDDSTISNGSATLFVEVFEIGNGYNILKDTALILDEQIDGVTSVIAKSDFKNGADVESDEELRQRYFETIKKSCTSGNVAHYELWTMEVEGVGACKVYPLKHGNGTVEVVVTNTEMLGASKELIDNVKDNIEINRPIGANVIVVSATEKAINVSAKIKLADGYTLDTVRAEFLIKLKQYLKEISFKTSYVSTARLGNLLLDTIGVFDYSNFTANGSMNNIALTDTEVPKVGDITLSEVL